jgi:hypothetical protein
MSSTLLHHLRKVALDTRRTCAAVAPQWREPFRVTDYYRPLELTRLGRGR